MKQAKIHMAKGGDIVIELFDKDNINPDTPSYTKKVTGTVWLDKNS